ncbi:hypothetical protein LCGC14_0468720 [marine sediment metagenome]|uniref:Uncharacterized protein n=1 Tax=marine sediment metagenome TaxID=412755 RepID=A0A0F9UZI1_9ZZZZ
MIQLPEKIEITKNVVKENLNAAARAKYDSGEKRDVFEPDDLNTAARVKYNAYYAERGRRADPLQPGVAQEALRCLAELKAAKRSTEELHRLGYSYRSTVKPAKADEDRVVRELRSGPSKDVTSPYFSEVEVNDMMTKYSIPEFIQKAVPE